MLGVFKCARYRLAPCLAGPDRLVSIVYVEDLVDGILAAALSPEAVGQTYFLANPEPVVWREFGVAVARVHGIPCVGGAGPAGSHEGSCLGRRYGRQAERFPAIVRTEKLDEMKQIAWVCSPEKAWRELNWRAATPLDRAVAKTAELVQSPRVDLIPALAHQGVRVAIAVTHAKAQMLDGPDVIRPGPDSKLMLELPDV